MGGWNLFGGLMPPAVDTAEERSVAILEIQVMRVKKKLM